MLLALVLAACGAPAPSADGPERGNAGLSEAATRNGLTLTATAERATVGPGEPIEVTAILSNDGQADVELTGSGSGIVFFSVTRLEDGLSAGPGWRLDCATHVVPVGDPIVVPFSKSGGFSQEDPNAAFMNAYFADPQLTLPSGTWRIDVVTHGSLERECGGPELDLKVALVVTVRE